MNFPQEDRRKKHTKPRIFNEKRASMKLIETTRPADFFLWLFCIIFMLSFIIGMIAYAIK